MDIQTLFNQSYQGVVRQGCASFNPKRGTCHYRDGKGNKCAIGHVIPDDQYQEEFESRRTQYVLDAIGIDPNSKKARMLFDMQQAHDLSVFENWNRVQGVKVSNSKFVNQFKLKATDIAKKYHLSIPS